MNYLSVFSGIESASVAFQSLHWKPFAFAEIDPFPCAVLAHHYGSNLNGEKFPRNATPNFGDVRDFKRWPVSKIDLLIGGSPCQSFSVAGLRKGLADPRGNLALTYLAITDKYQPTWVVWENVPGVLSSKQGKDFGAFLGGLAELGYGVAYRVLDAQYVRVDGYPRAVPQQRRRVFVVGYLGDWRRAAAVLFESESLQGYHPPRRQAGQGYTADTAPSLVSSGRGVERAGETRGQDPVVAVAPPVLSRGHNSGGNRPYGTDADTVNGLLPVSGAVSSKWVKQSGGPAGDECYNLVPVAQTLTRRMHKGVNSDLNEGQTLLPVANTITREFAKHGGRTAGTHGGGMVNAIVSNMRVRRLTPRECERLQGLPDDWTLVPYRNKPAADGPRYKAIGNSMAVNAIRWLGRRIELVEAIK